MKIGREITVTEAVTLLHVPFEQVQELITIQRSEAVWVDEGDRAYWHEPDEDTVLAEDVIYYQLCHMQRDKLRKFLRDLQIVSVVPARVVALSG